MVMTRSQAKHQKEEEAAHSQKGAIHGVVPRPIQKGEGTSTEDLQEVHC